jgi:hypothetical protein
MSPDKITDYLSLLQLPEPTVAKVMSTLAFYKGNNLLQIDDVFVSQNKDEDQNTRAVRLWMFGPNLCAEADITNGKIAGDVAAIKSRIRRYEIVASDEEFSDGDVTKYLKIHTVIVGGLGCQFQAFGKNREVLWNIFLKYINPNVIV